MPKYRVKIPAFTRTEEIHTIEADSPEEAIEEAQANDPARWEEDKEYYEVEKSGITAKELTATDLAQEQLASNEKE